MRVLGKPPLVTALSIEAGLNLFYSNDFGEVVSFLQMDIQKTPDFG